MPVVSIVEVSREGNPVSNAPARIFTVTNCSASLGNGLTFQVEIPSTPLSLVEEIRWYLEDFAVLSPLETKRADKARNRLKECGTALVHSIPWSSIVEPEERKDALILSIQEQPSENAPIIWELLEDPDFWDDSFKGGIFVSRYNNYGAVTPPITTEANNPGASSELNILVVSARSSQDGDIPHRIVSKVLHDKIRRQAGQLVSPTNLTLLRPATWEGFKQELKSKGKGFYSIIHFDMHGVRMGDGRQGLAFVEGIAAGAGGYEMKLKGISTSDVADVLSRHGVRRIVLNACRSAHYQDVDQSIALSLLKAGAEECVAMAFNIFSRPVEIFMSVFYDAILCKGLALDAAASWARMALRLQQSRTSRYATSVSIYDCIVPVCYTNTLARGSDAYGFKGRSLQFPRKPASNEVVGREDDILVIETCLLLSEKGVLLWGPAGTGKTSLLRHLGTWWQETGLVTGVYFHDCLDAPNSWNILEFWRGVYGTFMPGANCQDVDMIIDYLRKNRHLIVIDSLPEVPVRLCLRLVAQISKRMAGGSTKVILAGRSIEKWGSLDEYTQTHALKGLSKLDSVQLLRTYMNKVIQDLIGEPAKSVGESPEDLQCFEQIVGLLDGNPAALRVVTSAFLYSKANTMKEFLGLLMSGEPLMTSAAAQEHLWSMGSAENIRCVSELLKIIRSLTEPPQGQYAVPVEVLAPFWKVLPRNDFHVFLSAFAEEVTKGMGTPENRLRFIKAFASQDKSELKNVTGLHPEARDALASREGDMLAFLDDPGLKGLRDNLVNATTAPPPTVLYSLIDDAVDCAELFRNTPLYKHLIMASERITTPLKAAHFLAEEEGVVQSQQPADTTTSYYRVHPLVPLLLRASPLYHLDGVGMPSPTNMRQAFALYYNHRLKSWPYEHQYFEPQWEKVRNQLAFEFVNFASASITSSEIGLGMSEGMPNIALLRLSMFLQRGVGGNVSRLQFVQLAQEKALAFTLHQEKCITDALKRGPPSTSTSTEEAWRSEQQSLLYTLRMNGVVLSMGRSTSTGVGAVKAPDAQFTDLSRAFSRRMEQMGDPGEVAPWTKDVPMFQEAMEYIGSFGRFANGAPQTQEELEKWWAARQKFVAASAAITGDTSYATQSWKNFPTSVLSGARAAADITSAIKNAQAAIQKGELDEARRIIDEAWALEVLERNNDGHNKASLLRLRALICDMRGDADTAAEHRREMQEMESRLAGEAPADILRALGAAPEEEGLMVTLLRKLVDVGLAELPWW